MVANEATHTQKKREQVAPADLPFTQLVAHRTPARVQSLHVRVQSLEVAEHLSGHSHASQLIGRIVHLIHLRLLLCNYVLHVVQLLKHLLQALSGRWQILVPGQLVLELGNHMLIVLQTSQRSLKQLQTVLVQATLSVQLLPQLHKIVQALLQHWRLQRNRAECFLQVFQLRLQQVQPALVIRMNFEHMLQRVQITWQRSQYNLIQLTGHVLQFALDGKAFLGEDATGLFALLCKGLTTINMVTKKFRSLRLDIPEAHKITPCFGTCEQLLHC